MAAVTTCSDFRAPKIKSVTVSTLSPSICYEVIGLDAVILVFLILSFLPAFSLSSFTFIKRLFSSSLLSIPVFLTGESLGKRSLVGYSPQDCKESGMTEQLTLSFLPYFQVILQYLLRTLHHAQRSKGEGD